MANKNLIVNSDLKIDQKVRGLISALAQEQRMTTEALIKSFNISILQLNILDVLSYALHGTLTVNKIIEALVDESPNVSRSLRKLESLQLITKKRCDDDQRIVYVQVTKEGRQLRQRVKSQLPDSDLNLSETETQMLYELLSRL